MSAERALETDRETRKAFLRKARQRQLSRGIDHVLTVLSTVQAWADANERVACVYVSAERGVFHLRLVQTSPKSDFDLVTSLTNMAISLTDRGIDAVGSLLPHCSREELTAFFDPTDSVVIHRR